MALCCQPAFKPDLHTEGLITLSLGSKKHHDQVLLCLGSLTGFRCLSSAQSGLRACSTEPPHLTWNKHLVEVWLSTEKEQGPRASLPSLLSVLAVNSELSGEGRKGSQQESAPDWMYSLRHASWHPCALQNSVSNARKGFWTPLVRCLPSVALSQLGSSLPGV